MAVSAEVLGPVASQSLAVFCACVSSLIQSLMLASIVDRLASLLINSCRVGSGDVEISREGVCDFPLATGITSRHPGEQVRAAMRSPSRRVKHRRGLELRQRIEGWLSSAASAFLSSRFAVRPNVSNPQSRVQAATTEDVEKPERTVTHLRMPAIAVPTADSADWPECCYHKKKSTPGTAENTIQANVEESGHGRKQTAAGKNWEEEVA